VLRDDLQRRLVLDVNVLLELGEDRALGHLPPDHVGAEGHEHAGPEDQAPAPAVQRVVGEQLHEHPGQRAEDGAERGTHHDERGESAALADRSGLGEQRGAARLLGARAEALQEAQEDQQQRRPDADRAVGGQAADQERGRAHQEERADQHPLAAVLLPEVGEEQPAERPGGEADRVGRERRDEARGRGDGREEHLAEDQRGCGAVDDEVVLLEHRPDHARPCGAANVRRVRLGDLVGPPDAGGGVVGHGLLSLREVAGVLASRLVGRRPGGTCGTTGSRRP
jgi:hypothetical protein